MALNYEVPWWDDKNGVIYFFGGEKSGLPQLTNLSTPTESIWGFSPDNHGSGSWAEYLGPTADKPFPPAIARPSDGFYGTDGMNGYFLGGFITLASSNNAGLEWGAINFAPGLLTFNFASLILTNGTNVAWPFTTKSWHGPGRVVHAPLFGSAGILLAIGGQSAQVEAGGPFNNISIFDLESKKWYWQAAMGAIPFPRSNFVP